MPKLKLTFTLEVSSGAMGGVPLLGTGTKYWGATRGAVRLAGKLRRNLRGSVVVETWKPLSFVEKNSLSGKSAFNGEWPRIYLPESGHAMKHCFDLDPPCLAEDDSAKRGDAAAGLGDPADERPQENPESTNKERTRLHGLHEPKKGKT